MGTTMFSSSQKRLDSDHPKCMETMKSERLLHSAGCVCLYPVDYLQMSQLGRSSFPTDSNHFAISLGLLSGQFPFCKVQNLPG